MKGIFKKPLTFLLTGSFSMILAACYGTPIDMQNQKVIRTTDENNNPIQGLKVEVFQGNIVIGSVTTDNEGYANFENISPENVYAAIHDVDGTANGGLFKDSSFSIASDNYYEIKLKK